MSGRGLTGLDQGELDVLVGANQAREKMGHPPLKADELVSIPVVLQPPAGAQVALVPAGTPLGNGQPSPMDLLVLPLQATMPAGLFAGVTELVVAGGPGGEAVGAGPGPLADLVAITGRMVMPEAGLTEAGNQQRAALEAQHAHARLSQLVLTQWGKVEAAPGLLGFGADSPGAARYWTHPVEGKRLAAIVVAVGPGERCLALAFDDEGRTVLNALCNTNDDGRASATRACAAWHAGTLMRTDPNRANGPMA